MDNKVNSIIEQIYKSVKNSEYFNDISNLEIKNSCHNFVLIAVIFNIEKFKLNICENIYSVIENEITSIIHELPKFHKKQTKLSNNVFEVEWICWFTQDELK